MPLSSLNNKQLDLVRQGIDPPDEVDINHMNLDERQQNTIRKINELMDTNDDSDEMSPVNCKYYSIEQFKKKKFDPQKHFSLLHLNIHSLERHISELRIALSLMDHTFDFLCITESKIRENIIPKFDTTLKGYQKPVGTPTEAGKGGVLIYVKEGIDYQPREDLNIYKSKELESYFIETVNNPCGKNFIVGTVYRHPCMEPTHFTDDYMQPLLDTLTSENKKIFIAGDFNFDLLQTERNETFNFFESMMSSQFMPTITIPTKLNKKNDTIIDNIFINQIHPDTISGNLTIGISDHLPSFITIPRDNQNHLPKKHNLYIRCRKNYNQREFILDFLEIDWDEVLEAYKGDAHLTARNFVERFEALLDKHMPWRKITQKEFKKRIKPWINDEILEMIDKKYAAFKKYLHCKNEDRRKTLHEEYKQLKNSVTEVTRRREKDYYDSYFTENKNNLQKIWKGIKEVINIKAKSFSQPNCIIENNQPVTEPRKIANAFNNYFTSIADNILKKRKYEGRKSHRDYLRHPNPHTLAIYECDRTEIENLISDLDPKKKSGPHSLPVDILHLLKQDISYPLTIVFNLSLTTGVHPDILKPAKATPIFKKGSKLETGNYRPISLLSNLNKLLEKLMYARVYKFLNEKNCFYELQFGFRTRHSTTHTLIEITERLRQALDNNMVACGIFIDLQKAFDTVNHSILLDKLEHYGIRGMGNNWFKTYLSNRTQTVVINGFESDTKIMKHGVPQGSVLGPLLFLIYINDLHTAIQHSHVYHFADDTNLLNINNSPRKIQKQMNRDLKCLYNWLLANKISLNCSKTELIFFHKPGADIKQLTSLKIKINGHRLIPTDNIKYLGIYMDSTLSGKHHCKVLTTKLKRANGMLSKIRHYVPLEELRSIYYAIFSSHMTYGCQVWGQGTNGNIKQIETLQNRALRIINFKGPGTDTSSLYAKNKILKLTDLIKLNNCLFIHDYLHDNLPSCFEDYYFKLNNLYPLTETRNAKIGCLFVPVKNTTKYGLNSLTQQSIYTWNEISKTMNTDLSLKSRYELKSLIFNHFIKQYSDTEENNTTNTNNNLNNYVNDNHNIQHHPSINQRNQRAANNNYGQLRHDRPRRQFQSRWDDGPVNLI